MSSGNDILREKSHEAMAHALRLIRAHKCERVTTRTRYACITDQHLRADAEYTADRWCNSCIAHHGLRYAEAPGLVTPKQIEGAVA